MIETTPALRAAAKPRVRSLEGRLTERLVSDHVGQTLSQARVALELSPGRNPLLTKIEGTFQRVAVDLEPWPAAQRAFDEALVGRAEEIPLPAASVDLILARWVFEHVEDAGRATSEIARVLRPGGVCAFIAPNRRHPVFAANALLQKLLPFAVARRIAAFGARRPPDRVYRAYYRLSTPETLRRLWRPYGTAHIDLVDDSTYGIDLAFITRRLMIGCRPFLVGRLEREAAE